MNNSSSFFFSFVFTAFSLVGCGGASDVTLGGSDDSGVSDGVVGDDAASDAPRPATYPRLLLASAAGISVWNNVDKITAVHAPDVTLDLGGVGARVLAAHGDRLFVATKTASASVPAVLVFDSLSALGAGAKESARLPISAFPGTVASDFNGVRAEVDATGNLWVSTAYGPWLLGDAAKVQSSTTPRTFFTHPWGQIASLTYDPVGDRLIGGQISGAGVLVWNKPLEKGASALSDYSATKVSLWSQKLVGRRLYASGYRPEIHIWNDASTLSGAREPDITLKTTDDVASIVVRDDVLVAAGSQGTIMVWKDASKITGDVAPTFSIPTPGFKCCGKGVAMGRDGRLYVRDSVGISIFADAKTAPRFVTRLVDLPTDIGTAPESILYLE